MSRQLNVYRHPQASRRIAFPYLMVLQHDSVPPHSGEVLAAPLAPQDRNNSDRLQPLLDIEARRFQLIMPLMRRIPVHRLEAPVVSFDASRDRIIAAIDMLFAGS